MRRSRNWNSRSKSSKRTSPRSLLLQQRLPKNGPQRTKPVRKALPSHLPRESVVYTPACSCESCGGKLERLGEDVSEVLEYVPSHFKVIRHVRPKFACSACQSITQSPAPPRPIARGLAGPGLLAHVLVSKYCDHLPLYGQSEIYAREGVELERSTLADKVGQCSALLAPLVNALSRYVLSGSKLHADDTPVPVLQPGRGTTKHGRLWTYVRDDRASASTDPPAVWFAYSPDRKGVHPRMHLKDFSGVLQATSHARARPVRLSSSRASHRNAHRGRSIPSSRFVRTDETARTTSTHSH